MNMNKFKTFFRKHFSEKYRILSIHYSNHVIKYFIQYKCCGLFWLKIYYNEFLPSGFDDNRYNTSWGDIPIYEFDDLNDAKLALKWLLKNKKCLLGVTTSKEILYLIEEKEKGTPLSKFYGSTNYKNAEKLFKLFELEEPIKVIKKDKIYL